MGIFIVTNKMLKDCILSLVIELEKAYDDLRKTSLMNLFSLKDHSSDNRIVYNAVFARLMKTHNIHLYSGSSNGAIFVDRMEISYNFAIPSYNFFAVVDEALYDMTRDNSLQLVKIGACRHYFSSVESLTKHKDLLFLAFEGVRESLNWKMKENDMLTSKNYNSFVDFKSKLVVEKEECPKGNMSFYDKVKTQTKVARDNIVNEMKTDKIFNEIIGMIEASIYDRASTGSDSVKVDVDKEFSAKVREHLLNQGFVVTMKCFGDLHEMTIIWENC